VEHQKNSGDREYDEEKARNSSEAEGIRELKSMAFHLCGKEMEEEIVIHHHRPFQIRIRYSGSEDGAPYSRFCNPVD
jgi:hypothetical protein